MANLYYWYDGSNRVHFTNEPNSDYFPWVNGSMIAMGYEVVIEYYNGKFIFPESADQLFQGCTNGELVFNDPNKIDTSECTNMTLMFSGCGQLISLDISAFDMSNVTLADHMFSHCYDLQHILVKAGTDWSIDSKISPGSTLFENCYGLPNYNNYELTVYKAKIDDGYFELAPEPEPSIDYYLVFEKDEDSWVQSKLYLKDLDYWDEFKVTILQL